MFAIISFLSQEKPRMHIGNFRVTVLVPVQAEKPGALNPDIM
jgi:hypothetical protein